MNAGALGSARQFASGAGALADLLRPSVVEVRSGEAGSGAGVVWGGAGLIITNAHCVARGTTLTVGYGGERHAAHVVAYDARHDLALLGAGSVRGPLLEVRDASSLRAGELVFAHGHPLGVRDALAMGIVHGLGRDPRSDEPRWVLTDVRLAPGNSGGPLVDADGRLVGINSMIVNGLGVAIPSHLVQRLVERAVIRRAA